MKYSVLETSYLGKEEAKKVINGINTKNYFEKFVKNNDGNFLIKTFDTLDFLENKKYQEGYYIICNINRDLAYQVEKKIVTNKGYIYNSLKSEINLLKKWELFESIEQKYEFIPRTFNLSNMIDFPSISVIGQDKYFRAGMVLNLFKNINKEVLGNSLIITSQEENNHSLYSNKLNNVNVLADYNPKVVKQFINNTNEGVIVFDMSGYYNQLRTNGKWTAYNDLSNLIFQGRHLKKTVIVLCEDPFDIPSEFRMNFNYTFTYSRVKELNQNMNNILLNKYYKSFIHFNIFENFDQFKKVFNTIMDDNSVVVLNRTVLNKKDLQLSVLKYKIINC
jgi:hypothetical protein